MEERNKLTPIFKSNDPEKLVVFHASSLQNEIRFYINNTQYFTAVESEEGCLVRLEEKVDECNKKNKISIIKENFKWFIKLFLIVIGISSLFFLVVWYLSKKIDSIFVFLIIMNIIYFINNIVNVVIIETMETAPSIKSKHSAEHMMVNFLEINRRLPKNMDELKNSSRFSQKCSSRELVSGIAEEFLWTIFGFIFSVVVSMIVSKFSSNSTENIIAFLFTYFIVKFLVEKMNKKCGMFNFMIKHIKMVLINIVQCANTTRKVKDSDIILAYSVAREWLQVVYPEFYDENEDVFLKQYFKVNN